MAKTRIYLVTDLQGNATLVEAASPAQARGHVTRNNDRVMLASQAQLVEQLTAGAKVECASTEEEPETHV